MSEINDKFSEDADNNLDDYISILLLEIEQPETSAFRDVPEDLQYKLGSHDKKVTRYNMFRDLVLKPAVKPVFSISGNADCGVGLQFYQEYTGLPNHYTIMRRGIRFIFLGTTELSGHGRHICHVGKEGMDFLEKTLDEDKESTTVLFHHEKRLSVAWDYISPA